MGGVNASGVHYRRYLSGFTRPTAPRLSLIRQRPLLTNVPHPKLIFSTPHTFGRLYMARDKLTWCSVLCICFRLLLYFAG